MRFATTTESVFLAGDNLNEASERFRIVLSLPDASADGGTTLMASREITITDDDAITATLSGGGTSIMEGASGIVTVTLTGGTATADVVVNYVFSGADITAVDITGGLSGSITIDADATPPVLTGEIPIPAADDGVSDAGETLTVAATATSAGEVNVAGAPQTFTLVEDARILTVTGPAAIAEGAADVESGAYTVALDGMTFTSATDVTWAVTHGETADADFAAASDRSGVLTFTPSDTSMTFTLTVDDDTLNEATEGFTVQVSVANPDADGGTAYAAAHTTNITDEAADAIEVAIALDGGANVGEAAMANFSVTLSGGVRTADLIVPFELSGLDNAEYEITMPSGIAADATGGTLTFPVSGTPMATDSLTIAVNLQGDTVNEAAETLTITGTAPGAAGLRTAGVVRYAAGGDSAAVMVDDDDPITVSVARHSSTPATIDEGATATFTFSLDVASAGVVTVPYTVANTTAGYTPADSDSGSVTIAAGQMSQDITLMMPFSQALGSSTPDGTVTVTLGAASVAAPGGGTVASTGSDTVTVNYLDAAHTIVFTGPTISIVEGETATYTVTRTGPAITGSIVVSWTYAAGTTDPAAAADFAGSTVPAGGTLTFTGSETAETFEIVTMQDTASEPDESFTLGLTAAPAVLTSEGGVSLPADIGVVIGESDQAVTLSVTAPSGGLTEGTAANFAVSFPESVTTTVPVTVDWAISFPAGTDAAAAADFAVGATSGTASIAAGAMSVNVAITALADSLNEAEERFTVTLSAPAGGGAIAAPVLAGTPSADAAIAASDPITVSVARHSSTSATIDEGATATFTFSLDVASAGVVTVPYTVANTTAGYTPADSDSGSVTIAAGQMSQDITLMMPFSQTLGSSTPDGTVTVTLGAASVAAPGGGTVTSTGSDTVTVNYLDAAHTIVFTGPTISIVEGETATYTVTRNGPAITGSIVVSWTYAAGTTDPAAAADFAGGAVPAGGMLTFTGSETAETFEIVTMQDTASEPDESFTLGLTAAPAVLTSEGGVSLPADISVVIGESDQAVTLSVTAPSGGLTEGTAANFAVSFPESVTTTVPVTVDWAISFPAGTDAAAAADFAVGATSGTASIAAGAMSVNVAITALADSLNEAEERFIVTLSNPAGGGAIAAPVLAGTPSADATIAASDPVTVSVAAGTATVNEGNSATFTVTLSNASAAAVMVPWMVNELSDPDVIGVTGATLNFAAETATLTQDIVVPIGSSQTLDDTSMAETLTVTLGTLAGGHGTLTGTGATATAMVNWVTAAHTVAFASPPTNVAEGASATFVVTRTGPAITGIPIVVSWQVAAGSTGSAAADDFAGGALPGGMVTFTGSQTMRSFVVATQEDNRSEMSETFTVGLSASSEVLNSNGGVALGAATGDVTITDNDTIRVSLTGPATVAESAPVTYTVALSAAPTVPVTMTWTVAAGAPSGDVIAAAAADFMDSVFPTGMLSFAVGVTSQSLSFTTTEGPVIDGSTDNTPNRAFMITLSNIAGGGGTMMPMEPAAFEATLREDDPVARMVRMDQVEQAATTLNRAAVTLSVPVIARRFDPGRGLARSSGLALNLGGKQVLAPPGGVAASAGGGAGGYAAIGLPKSAIPASQSAIPASLPVIPAEAGIQHTNSPAPAGHQPDAGVGAVPAPVAGAVLAQTPGGALSAAPDAPPAADGQGSPSQTGPALLDMGALAELAASQLEGLDSLSPSTESRTLQQLLGNSGFSATSDQGGGRTLSVWGRGSYTSLDGEPETAPAVVRALGGNRYDYDGDSYAFFLGLDGRYGDYLAGLAVGYTVGDLEWRTAGAAAGDRSDFESDLVAVYPYASWQPSDRLSVWVLGGYGQGELEIEERRGGAVGKASSDTDLWLGAAGLSWRRPVADVDMLLRLSGTALHGETDGGTLRFGGGMPDETYSETETDAQQLRGEMELGRVFGFEDGGRLRPYLTAGVSYDFGDGSRDAATGEFGTGFQLHWPRLGLETELEFQARLSSKDDRDYQEYTGTGTLRYDLGGDRRGLQLAVAPAFGLAQGVGLDGADGLGGSLDGGAFGGAPTSLPGGGAGGGLGSGPGNSFGLHSELSYGIGNVRALRGLPGLLTLYGAGGLSAGAGRDLYRSGVRFEAARFTLDAGLRHESGGGDSDTGFLLDGAIRF